MRDRLSTDVKTCLFLLLILGLMATPAVGQPPSASCDGSENLSGTDTTPQTLPFSAPWTNAFTMTGTNCTEAGFDHVTCFTPENSCNVNIDCFDPSFDGSESVAVNLYQGPCATSPTCISSDSGTDSASVFGILTGGTQYCVACESSDNTGTVTLSFDVDSGMENCGALPVQLQHFSIGGDEAGDSAPDTGPSEVG